MHSRQEQLKAFDRLLTVMDDLRERCPWDRKQTFDSLRENTIEETYELCSAITRHDMDEIRKELGDVLLHIVFYAKMGSETEDFDIADVCNSLCDKLIFRHPHVYGVEEAAKYGNISIPDAKNMNPDDVKKLWELVKQQEKDGNKMRMKNSIDKLFYVRGAMDRSKLVGNQKFILGLVNIMMVLFRHSPDDKLTREVMNKGGDLSSEDQLDPVLEWYASLR